MRADHRFFSVDGLRLHALQFGGEGRPMFLLHGAMGHAWSWVDVAGQLTLWGRVFALDLRGHGDSQWSASQAYSTNRVAQDVAAVIEELGEPADVVGLSWGGLVALRLAARRPDLIRRLAVLNPPLDLQASAGEVAPGPYQFTSRADLYRWERGANPAVPSRLTDLVADHSVRPGPDGSLARKHDPFFERSWPDPRERFEEDWAALRSPTLLVRSASSPVLDADTFAAMLAAQPRAVGQTIPESGHLLVLDQPVAVADALESFVREEVVDAAVAGPRPEVVAPN